MYTFLWLSLYICMYVYNKLNIDFFNNEKPQICFSLPLFFSPVVLMNNIFTFEILYKNNKRKFTLKKTPPPAASVAVAGNNSSIHCRLHIRRLGRSVCVLVCRCRWYCMREIVALKLANLSGIKLRLWQLTWLFLFHSFGSCCLNVKISKAWLSCSF